MTSERRATAEAEPSPRSQLTNSPADEHPMSTRGLHVSWIACSSGSYSCCDDAKRITASGVWPDSPSFKRVPRSFPAAGLFASLVNTTVDSVMRVLLQML